MTWHLKDKTVESALCGIYPEFLTALNHAAELSAGDDYVAVKFNRKDAHDNSHENCLMFLPDELEVIDEYNPRAWNDYQKVTPPEGVWMRVETTRKVGAKAMFKNGYWVEPDGHYFVTGGGRFRPWED